MCAQHQLLGVHAGGKLLVLWHFANKGIDSSYESRSTFFSLLPGGKEKKIYFQSVHFWFFRNRLVSSRFSQGAVARGQRKESIFRVLIFFFWKSVSEFGIFSRCSEKNYIFRTDRKNEFYPSNFLFFSDTIFKGWGGLENWQNFLKNHLSLVSHIYKNDPIALALWHVVEAVNVIMLSKF